MVIFFRRNFRININSRQYMRGIHTIAVVKQISGNLQNKKIGPVTPGFDPTPGCVAPGAGCANCNGDFS